jgi:hypothetical protein
VLLVLELAWGVHAHFHLVAFHYEVIFDTIVSNFVKLKNFAVAIYIKGYQRVVIEIKVLNIQGLRISSR